MSSQRKFFSLPVPKSPARRLPSGWAVLSDLETQTDHQSSSATRLPGWLTLQQAWERWRWPALRDEGRRASTIADYKTALAHWSRWCRLRFGGAVKQVDQSPETTIQKHGVIQFRPSVRTTEGPEPELGQEGSTIELAEPSIDEIDKTMLTNFRSWLAEEQTGSRSARSKLTVNRIVRNIRSILLAAESAGAIGGAPSLRRLPAAKNRRKVYVPLDHAEAIYRAARVANWPRHDERRQPLPHAPATYWRAAIVLWWCYGFRTQELIAYEPDHEPLSWSQISYETTSPNSDIQSDHGWLWYVPQKQEAIKPEPMVLPLAAIAKKHLQSIRPKSGGNIPGGARSVFPFPRWKKEFYGTWSSIVGASGVRPRGIIGDEDYQIKHLRKSCATYHNLHNRGIAPFILGHASREDSAVAMTDGHYDNVEIALVRHFASVPVPQAFMTGGPISGQLELF